MTDVIKRIRRFRTDVGRLPDDSLLLDIHEAIATRCDLMRSDFHEAFPEARSDEYQRTPEWHAFIGSTLPDDVPQNANDTVRAWVQKVIETFLDDKEPQVKAVTQ